MKASAEISELENEHLIQTLAELNDKTAGIKALSISKKQKEVQLINLVKVESKIRTKLLGQKDAKITLSHKGKKSSEELLRELRSVIKQYECTLTETIDLNLVDVSTDPSLLLDCHIKHKWLGEANSIKEWNQFRNIKYDGEEVYYEFSYDELLQDYRDGDLLVYRKFQ